jgi:hypothetical protein
VLRWRGSVKVIVSLRADYNAIKTIKNKKELLEKQGIIILNDYTNMKPDVIISPLKNTPEYEIYYNIIKNLNNVIYEDDSDIALFKAITYPKLSFSHLLIGIDSGRLCGYIIMGDGIIINSGKIECSDIGNVIKNQLSKIPYRTKEVILGNGEGWNIAAVSLIKNGLPYKMIREDEVAKFMPKTPIFKIFKDKDVRSAMAIALRGSKNWMDR